MEELMSFKLTRTECERVLEYLYNAIDYFDGKAVRALFDNNNEEYLKNKAEKTNIYNIVDKLKAAKRG